MIWFTVITCSIGALFFIAGSVGLVRFNDLFCRFHSLTKADNVGLGLICLGLIPWSGSASNAIQIIIIWVLVLVSSAAGSFLLGQHALRIHKPKKILKLEDLQGDT